MLTPPHRIREGIQGQSDVVRKSRVPEAAERLHQWSALLVRDVRLQTSHEGRQLVLGEGWGHDYFARSLITLQLYNSKSN